MSEENNSLPAAGKEKDSTLLLTKDGQRYYVSKSGVLDSRNVITPHEPDNNASSCEADDPDEESDVLDTSDPRDSAASPEELNDEETSEGDNAPKQCIYEGCKETTTQVAKQRKPWMCKKHRNKMYKDKYKKKKSDQAMSSGKLDVRRIDLHIKVSDSLIYLFAAILSFPHITKPKWTNGPLSPQPLLRSWSLLRQRLIVAKRQQLIVKTQKSVLCQ